VFSNVDKTCVKDVFEELFGEGCVERIDMIQKTAGNLEKFQRVFVHFKYWPVTQRNQQVRQRLIDGYQIKIVYNDPWFWKCSASRIPKPKDKVNRPSGDEAGETYNSIGEKKGKKMDRGTARQHELMMFNSPQDFGEMTGDATGRDATGRDATGRDDTGRDDTGRDATGRDDMGRDDTGRDDNISGTGWRQVNKRMRGKKK